VKIGYGTTGFAGFMTFALFFTYGMLFFTDTVGLGVMGSALILGGHGVSPYFNLYQSWGQPLS